MSRRETQRKPPRVIKGTAADNEVCAELLRSAEPKIRALLDKAIEGGINVALVVIDPFWPVDNEGASPLSSEERRALIEVAEADGGVPLVAVLRVGEIADMFADSPLGRHEAAVDRLVRAIGPDRDPTKMPVVYTVGHRFGFAFLDLNALAIGMTFAPPAPAFTCAGGAC